MIYIIDEFLRDNILNKLNNYLVNFKEFDAGDKKFWIMNSTQDFDSWMVNKISEIENKKINNILSFFRIATNELDTDWRIHCDSIINGQQPTRAIVLYLSDPGLEELNGTALWEHKDYGYSLDNSELTSKKYDDLLLNHSNVLDNWKLNTVVGYRKNRLISYPSNYFHSKYPNKCWEQGRKIYVMFYK
jgi:hypothetical protein|tara:strand:- start:301 stop:864 length:564 start_codon:yes stop_codon:yes gene_type:complete